MASLAPAPTSGYRGRLAPSPTGYLHVGHGRTFWTAWQRTREAGGTLVMRMEDLDPERSKAEFAEALRLDPNLASAREMLGRLSRLPDAQ